MEDLIVLLKLDEFDQKFLIQFYFLNIIVP